MQRNTPPARRQPLFSATHHYILDAYDKGAAASINIHTSGATNAMGCLHDGILWIFPSRWACQPSLEWFLILTRPHFHNPTYVSPKQTHSDGAAQSRYLKPTPPLAHTMLWTTTVKWPEKSPLLHLYTKQADSILYHVLQSQPHCVNSSKSRDWSCPLLFTQLLHWSGYHCSCCQTSSMGNQKLRQMNK